VKNIHHRRYLEKKRCTLLFLERLPLLGSGLEDYSRGMFGFPFFAAPAQVDRAAPKGIQMFIQNAVQTCFN
jgi:hypothetical protein